MSGSAQNPASVGLTPPAAVDELLARRAGTSRPSGNYHWSKVYETGWHPDPAEVRACCTPRPRGVLGTRAHLRSLAHIANRYAVTPSDLTAAVKSKQRADL